MNIPGFGIGQILIWLLVFARTAGIFTTAPVFGNSHVPVTTRVGLAACLALIFTPLASAGGSQPPSDALDLVFALVKEAAVGLAIGFVGMLLFMVVQSAAELVSLQTGLGFAAVVDPMNNQQTSVLAQFQNLVATMLFLTINGHHILLQGLAESFAILPLGRMSFGPAAAGTIMTTFEHLFLAAIKIGGPIVGVILLTDVALGILARTVPQLNVLVVGFPAKIFVGLVTVVIAMPAAFVMMRTLFGGLGGDMHVLVQALTR